MFCWTVLLYSWSTTLSLYPTRRIILALVYLNCLTFQLGVMAYISATGYRSLEAGLDGRFYPSGLITPLSIDLLL